MIEKNIILIGPPGSGKSVCGSALAEKLGYEFIDTDQVIEARTGKKVQQLFQAEGEAYFRGLETSLLSELLASKRADRVIASGGGLPVTEGNFEKLICLGTVIYLRTEEEVLLTRLNGGAGRPLLSSGGQDAPAVLTRLRSLLEARAAVYEQAQHLVDTTFLTPSQVVETIIAKLRL